MSVAKIVVGDTVRLDLTQDTVTPSKLLYGETAHNQYGAPITGEKANIDVEEVDHGSWTEVRIGGFDESIYHTPHTRNWTDSIEPITMENIVSPFSDTVDSIELTTVEEGD